MKIKALVLAAGKGTRMRGEGADLPKVMLSANGRPLLWYVLDALSFLPREDIILVTGYKRKAITAAFPAYPAVVQAEQLGTGHAVLSAAPALRNFDGSVLVCCGDMPLMKSDTYRTLIKKHVEKGNACTLLSGVSEQALPYGRIVRDGQGRFLRIVEDRDCTDTERAIRELNAGVYVFESRPLLKALARLKQDNAQGEYYLTDVPALMLEGGEKVGVCDICTPREMLGVNTPDQLARAEAGLREKF